MMYQAYKLSYHYLAQIVKSYMKLLSQILTMITTTTVITGTIEIVPYETNTGIKLTEIMIRKNRQEVTESLYHFTSKR